MARVEDTFGYITQAPLAASLMFWNASLSWHLKWIGLGAEFLSIMSRDFSTKSSRKL